MTHETFRTEMQRLKNTFGEHTYSEERIKLIWRFCEHRPGEWFTQAVDFFLSDSRSAPILSQIKENYFTWERKLQKANAYDSQILKEEEHPSTGSKLPPEFIKEIQTMIAKKMAGTVSKKEFDVWKSIAYKTIELYTGKDRSTWWDGVQGGKPHWYNKEYETLR